MATVYILYSKSADKFYIGSTLDFDQRLDYHLNKEFQNSFTAKYLLQSFFSHIVLGLNAVQD
ncbi:hypothetical protein BH11BAC2_BH11BAC2_09890 [soil metagenome]